MSDLNPLFEPKITNVMSSMFRGNAFRLNAEVYSGNVFLPQEFAQNESMKATESGLDSSQCIEKLTDPWNV
jgi:hypothetical protein